MHEPARRQLFSSFQRGILAGCCAALFLPGAFAADGKAKGPPALEQELQAASVTEDAMLAKDAGQEGTQAAKDDMEKMAGIYSQIVARHPKNAEALNAEAEYLWKIDRRDEAMEQWNTAETLEPGNAEVANNLGACQLALGDAKKSTEYFERAAKLDPSNALYEYNAGNTCCMFRHQVVGDGNDAEPVLIRALEYYRQAARIEPFSVEYARSYAETFYFMREPDWNAALKAWTHYLQITDKKDFAYSNLARVNLKLGNKKEAEGNLSMIKNGDFAPFKQHLQHEIDAK